MNYEPQAIVETLLTEESLRHEVASEQIIQDDVAAVSNDQVVSTHTEMQYYLASLGKSLGYEIWIPKGDQGRIHGRTKLAEFSESEFPPMPFSERVLRIIRNIDVIWMQDAHPTHIFEVEHTTSIHSGLLRMSDLMTMLPSMQIGMFICADETRKEKVIAEVNRPTFARKPLLLPTRCRLITFDGLRTFIGDIQHDYLRHFASSILDELSESLLRRET